MRLDGCAWSGLALVLVVAAGCRPAEDQPGPVVADLADHCPDPATPIPYPPGGRLPDGAVGVRLCNGVEDFNGYQADVDAPVDELTTGVGGLVDLVNSSTAVPAPQDCTFEAGPDLVFWFRYQDGTARAVRHQRYGCRNLMVREDRERVGGDVLHQAFSDRLLAQREGLQPPGGAPRPDCSDQHGPGDPALDVASGLDLERAVVCVRGRGTWRRSPELTERQIRRVEDDFRVDPLSRGGGCRPRHYTRILGFTAWGDRIDLGGPCWNLYVPALAGFSGSGNPTYRPSPDVQRMLHLISEGDGR